MAHKTPDTERPADALEPENTITKPQPPNEAAERAGFKKKVWGPWLSPVVALISICIVTSLLLSLTNELTAPLIAANAESVAAAERQTLLPQADSFETVDLEGLADNVTAMYRAANGAGWVVESYGRGYGGQVPAMTAFDAEGSIVGVTFLENNETPGLGQKLVTDAGFAAQFSGLPAESISLGDVDKIASATISTGAALNAVNAAIEAYAIKALGATSGSQSPEEIREGLLPGEALGEISIAGTNVQPAAWRSAAGNYIIYGEKPPEGEYGSLVVAAVAMDENGVILDLWIDTSGESEQYGQTLATNRQFLQSFIGESAPVKVDVVADITNSSNSVMEAVNNALAALPLAKEAA